MSYRVCFSFDKEATTGLVNLWYRFKGQQAKFLLRILQNFPFYSQDVWDAKGANVIKCFGKVAICGDRFHLNCVVGVDGRITSPSNGLAMDSAVT